METQPQPMETAPQKIDAWQGHNTEEAADEFFKLNPEEKDAAAEEETSH